MTRWHLSRYASSVSVTVVLLAGCGGSQPPIGAPGAMPQSRALAARPGSTNYKVVYNFGGPPDGQDPVVALHAGSLTPKFAVLFRFDKVDGAGPSGGFVSVGGTLYGTTYTGGTGGINCGDSDGCGTVYSITRSGKEAVLYEFVGVPDGGKPVGRMIKMNGTLYGATFYGGTGTNCNGGSLGCGTVFSVTTQGKEHVLHSFRGPPDGTGPTAGLIDVNGTLYGTTGYGGTHGGGTFFSVTTAGKERVLYNFAGKPPGAYEPLARLLNVNGTLYGTTFLGGSGTACSYSSFHDGCGTVFSVTTNGKMRVLYSFVGPPDGANPLAGLTNVKGKLYGTTSTGGTGCVPDWGCGTVFRITTTGKEHVVYKFTGNPDGDSPEDALVDTSGVLYGTTYHGGTHNDGTVFSMTTVGKEAVLHSFGVYRNGRGPGDLSNSNAKLYGETSGGGDVGAGTVFTLTP